MFFVTILAGPILAGLVAGVLTDLKAVPWTLSGLCMTLGVAGAIATALDPDVTGRAGAVAFAVIAGLLAAGLVWAGFAAGRLTRNSAAHPS